METLRDNFREYLATMYERPDLVRQEQKAELLRAFMAGALMGAVATAREDCGAERVMDEVKQFRGDVMAGRA